MNLSSEKGQTAVEYILLLVVVVTITITIAKKVTEHFAASTEDCESGQSNNIMCQLYGTFAASPTFRYFRLVGRREE